MDEVLTAANDRFSSFLGSAVDFRTCRTTQHGDIFCLQKISESLRKKISEKGVSIEDLLSLEHFHGHCFSKVTISPQGQLCVSLNRSMIFAKCVSHVTTLGDSYGTTSLSHSESSCVSLLSHVTLPESSIASASRHDLSGLSVEEGRNVLVTGLLANVLRVSGYTVDHVKYNLPSKISLSEADPDFHIWHLLSPFITCGPELPSNPTKEIFLSSLSSHSTSRTPGGEMVVSVEPFLLKNSLTGRNGFDKNLDKIQVTDEKSQLTCAASVGHTLCALCQMTHGGSHVIINVAEQRKSYSVQQSMALAEVFNKAHHITCRQHLLLTGGASITRNGVIMKQCSLKELISIRSQQMAQAYVGARGPQLQTLAKKMAEAVIKFELLSADTSSIVKLELPAIDCSDSNVRFAGAFVLYNYARVATVLSTFSKQSIQGAYPCLPAAKDVDFTLLTDEDEWKLLFHYVLQYPLVTREAARMKTTGVGIHITMYLKKICLFLVELSHLFSSYYSRVKILLPPEPHLLPVIFARLHLVAAVRQVMYNSLRLLVIEPPEQL